MRSIYEGYCITVFKQDQLNEDRASLLRRYNSVCDIILAIFARFLANFAMFLANFARLS